MHFASFIMIRVIDEPGLLSVIDHAYKILASYHSLLVYLQSTPGISRPNHNAVLHDTAITRSLTKPRFFSECRYSAHLYAYRSAGETAWWRVVLLAQLHRVSRVRRSSRVSSLDLSVFTAGGLFPIPPTPTTLSPWQRLVTSRICVTSSLSVRQQQ